MSSKMPDSPHESVAAGEIFIVDDDPGVRATLTTIFERAGYRVVAFADGASFLAHARTATPVSIILDVHIPGRSGLDILRELHAQDYPAPIFIVSGQGDIPMAVDAIRAGALDFIEKPFRGSEVVERVKQAISAYSLRKQDDPGLAGTLFPGPRAADAARARGAGNDPEGRVGQGSRAAARHQPSHHRGASRQADGEVRRQERHRPDADRVRPGPAAIASQALAKAGGGR